MVDAKTDLFGQLLEGLTAKVDAVKAKARNGIGRNRGAVLAFPKDAGRTVITFHQTRGSGGIQPGSFPAHFQGLASGMRQERQTGRVPKMQPRIFPHIGRKPMVEDIIHHGPLRVVERENERFGTG